MSDLGLLPKVAAIQMAGSRNLEVNLDEAQSLIELAVTKGAQLLVLPENFAYLGCKEISSIAKIEKSIGPARKFLSEQAIKHKVWIVGGTIPVAAPTLPDGLEKRMPSASCFVVDDSGCEVACYQKMHLFDASVDDKKGSYLESSEYSPGNAPVVVDTPFGRLGLAICYDLRFPELFRYLTEHGAELIAIPSAFTSKTGEFHWNLLLRARAVENLTYIIGANLGDRDHPKRPTWGGSAIIDPWGKVISEMQEGSGVVTASIDLAYLNDTRIKFPVNKHRRFSLAKPQSSSN